MHDSLSQWGLGAQQRVQDASLHLQLVRARHCTDLQQRGRASEAEIVTGGLAAMRGQLRVLLDDVDELLAVTAYAGEVVTFGHTHEVNRAIVARGVRMLSLFNGFGLEPAVRQVIVQADEMPYYLGYGHLQMKVLDRRCVVVEGPVADGERSLLLLHSREAVAAGLEYIRAVRATSVRAAGLRTPGPVELSLRQEAEAGMLTAGFHDRAIAASLGVSVRTVRTDVADLMHQLGTTTRFSAGTRYAQLKQLGF